MSISLSKSEGFWPQIRAAARWRIKRLQQYLYVRYLSWRNSEICIADVRIPLTKYISDNVREAMFRGGYESAELHTIADNLSNDDRVLEIGTGIGLISSYCAKSIGSERIFTFEANPELEPCIRQVYECNSVSPHLDICILGEGNGEESFYIHDDFWSSSLYRRSSNTRKVTVPRKDFKQTLALIRPTFLIMDIEGGEFDLLKLATLDGINKVAIEIHTHILGKDRVAEIHLLLSKQGFAVDWRYSRAIDGFKEELYLYRSPSNF